MVFHVVVVVKVAGGTWAEARPLRGKRWLFP
jgi:hypothetical protein